MGSSCPLLSIGSISRLSNSVDPDEKAHYDQCSQKKNKKKKKKIFFFWSTWLKRVNLPLLQLVSSRKRALYTFDPLKSHFYIVKLGFTGVYIIFLISAQICHRLWVLVRTASPRRFLRVPIIYVLKRNMKNISFLSAKNQFLEV